MINFQPVIDQVRALLNVLTPSKSDILANANAATANNEWITGDLENYKYIGVQVNATGLNTADSVVKLQDSIDGTNFIDITGATLTLSSGSSNNMFRVTNLIGRKIKVVFTKGTNSAGTLDVHYSATR